MADPRTVLEQARLIAVIGMSTDQDKPSHHVPVSLRDAGWRIIPVHPEAEEVAGEPAVASLADIEEAVDVVEVFRPAEEAPGIAREAAEAGAGALWLQEGITSAEARQIAEDAGMDYVEDECMHKVRVRHGLTRS
jgi:predicted CoA-binding protein